jgi:hypothetical protein
VEVLHVPGHTPADVAYKIGDASSLATRCSCPTRAPRGRISRAAMREHFIARSAGSRRCLLTHACSCATTTRRRAAIITPG